MRTVAWEFAQLDGCPSVNTVSEFKFESYNISRFDSIHFRLKSLCAEASFRRPSIGVNYRLQRGTP
jgi:hypothetical protein